MKLQPYLIVPNLIEQPTWGGGYIAKQKHLPLLYPTKIGQSYELFEQSTLSTKTSTADQPSYELSQSKNPDKPQKHYPGDKPFNINQLIKQNPQTILGKKVLKRHGQKIKILIKFTQAQGNSYQIHVRKNSGSWLSKPESWYFFKTGLITLGTKPGVNWQNYQQTCQAVDQLANDLSQQIKTKQLPLSQAQRQLKNFIQQNNPAQFVNLVKIKPDQVVDVSKGGIHHSWEQIMPDGNVLYEVQLNVYDPVSTIRSFDKGKIKSDGSIRSLQINDYFKHINRSSRANRPSTHIKKPRRVNSYTRQILKTPNYSLQELTVSKPTTLRTTDSYHHLFVRQGSLGLTSADCRLTLTQGFSVFIPASTGRYQLSPQTKSSTILKTYL